MHNHVTSGSRVCIAIECSMLEAGIRSAIAIREKTHEVCIGRLLLEFDRAILLWRYP